MTVSFDSNVLIYAFSVDEPVQSKARVIVETLAERGGSLPEQVIREFLAIAQRRRFMPPTKARQIATSISERFEIVTGASDDLWAASELAERHKLQYCDSLLCCTARRAGCSFLLSRDMQDGFTIGAMRIINPFVPANDDLVAELLS